MKYMKKFTSLLLVLAMTLGLTTAAFADGTNTITVTNTVAGQRYDLYKILDLDVNADLSAYSYTVNSAWKALRDSPMSGSTRRATSPGRTMPM